MGDWGTAILVLALKEKKTGRGVWKYMQGMQRTSAVAVLVPSGGIFGRESFCGSGKGNGNAVWKEKQVGPGTQKDEPAGSGESSGGRGVSGIDHPLRSG